MFKATLTALAVLLAVPAYAQSTCGPREGLEESMRDQYGETRVSVALDQNGFLIEVWANPDNATWTATLTTPDGQTCIAAYGTSYEDVTAIPGVDG
jgi:hypothetical protein